MKRIDLTCIAFGFMHLGMAAVLASDGSSGWIISAALALIFGLITCDQRRR